MALDAGAQPVLVGAHEDYAQLGLPMLPDRTADAGPLAGMDSLMRFAGSRLAFAIACDLPHLPSALLTRLAVAITPEADAAMVLRNGGLEPMCALFRSDRVLPQVTAAMQESRRSLRSLAARLTLVKLPIEGQEAHWLDDWDTPQDAGMAG